jgi:cytidine deaminase
MRQLLGAPDSSGFLTAGFSDMPQYSIYPASNSSPRNFFDKSVGRSLSQSLPHSPSKSPLQISVHDGTQYLGSSQSFAPRINKSSFSNPSIGNMNVLSHPQSMNTNNLSLLSYPQTQNNLQYNNSSGTARDAAVAQLIYNANFSGLESHGASGMTILEELTDVSLKVCENGRIAGQKHNSRGAALLTSNGKVYSGCDVYFKERDPNGISAERSAVMAAVADGSSVFQCLVLSTDTMISFPVPDGQSREFLRGFGVFPVILVNCELDIR